MTAMYNISVGWLAAACRVLLPRLFFHNAMRGKWIIECDVRRLCLRKCWEALRRSVVPRTKTRVGESGAELQTDAGDENLIAAGYTHHRACNSDAESSRAMSWSIGFKAPRIHDKNEVLILVSIFKKVLFTSVGYSIGNTYIWASLAR